MTKHVTVDLCVYCFTCHHVYRVATLDDTNGTYEECPKCKSLEPTIVGVHVQADEEKLLKHVYDQFSKDKLQAKLSKLLEWRSK